MYHGENAGLAAVPVGACLSDLLTSEQTRKQKKETLVCFPPLSLFDSSWVPTPLGDSTHIQDGCICHVSITVTKHWDQGNSRTEAFMWAQSSKR